MKKFLTIAIVLVVSIVMLTGCGGSAWNDVGTAPERDQLNGIWQLTRMQTDGLPDAQASFRDIAPGHPLWAGGYFIEFDEEGNFAEIDFWNWHWFDVVSEGTFTLNGNNLTLVRTGGIVVTDMEYAFIGSRYVGINNDGNTLTITYRRSNWTYTATFTRV